MLSAEFEAAAVEAMRGSPTDLKGGLVVPKAPGLWRLRHLRRDKPRDELLGLPPQRRLAGRYNYGGPVLNHFGHFMIETMHRVVPSLLAHPDRPFLFVGSRQVATPLPFMRDLWRLVGIAEPVIVSDDVAVDGIFVHQQGSNYLGTTHAAYLDLLDGFDRLRPDRLPPPAARGRIYVSRTGLPGPPALLGERALEAALEAAGFAIVRPEALPLAVQIATWQAADVVVVGEGSAVHALELLGRRSVRTVFHFNRRAQPADQTAAIRRLLSTRAGHLVDFAGNRYVGTLSLDRRGRDIPAEGTTVLDVPGILEALRAAGLVSGLAVDPVRAAEVAREDFGRYVAGGPRGGGALLAAPDLAGGLSRAFEAALAAVYGGASVRTR